MAEQKEKNRSLKAEIAGIVSAALFLLTALSLVFYHLGTGNLVGTVGNNIASILFVTVGYGSYFFPLLFLFVAIEFLTRFDLKFRVTIPISLVLFVSSFSGIFALVAGAENTTAGGIIGNFLRHYLGIYLGAVGTFIALFAVLIISMRIGTGLSFVELSEKAYGISSKIAGWMYAKWKESAERRKEAAELAAKEAEENAKKEPLKAEEKEDEPKEKKPKTAPTIVTHAPAKPKKQRSAEGAQEAFAFANPKGAFQLPPLTLLDPPLETKTDLDKDTILTNSKILEKKLKDFDVDGTVVEVRPGPVVTTYEFEPAPGVKVNKITNLSDDLALAMRAHAIRILAPVPGKAVVGIEIPNAGRETICFRELLEGPSYQKSHSKLALAIGKDTGGAPLVADLAKMPHLLVAGATGAGKSVSVNAMILSMLYKATPDDVRFLMIDPKMLELSLYQGIPHLLTPVVTDVKRATLMLKGIVTEMEKRYKRMSEVGAKNIEQYNEMMGDKTEPDKGTGHGRLPFIVVIIDELADLMMASGKDVEESLVRLSQMARASGIHLILATQRPSVDVITGLIKANFPARIAFQVPSRVDSRTILDAIGAEALLGQGDMLFLPPGSSKIKRVHGVYVSEKEIKKVTEFLKKQAKPVYSEEEIISEKTVEKMEEESELGDDFMARYREAVEMAEKMDMVSTSYIQRRFRIGYNTAARIIEKMESEGVVGPAQGSRPREVLKRQG